MQRLEVSGAVRPPYGSLGVKGLTPPELFFLNFSTLIYKMRIIQRPNTLEL